ncbi:MAG: release factor glutamine methyltransferase [Microgenomates group bacterium Gr01-1014_7]|nr:MAG: release factor glutamine methyltransferase [Microgenomates group bacterium Gr01-1014_7]
MGTLTQSSMRSRPKQYIQGWVEFYKLKFKVTPDVLIPRPETEFLVDQVLQFAKNQAFTALDIGTGSGNIAISIAKNNKKIKVFATEISEKALEVARKNAKLNKVEKRIFFIQSDLLSNVKNVPDVIVTNLPYIPTARISYLDPSVKDFEPVIALDGGPDGFDLYRKLFAQIKNKFTNGVNSSHPRGGIRTHRLKLIVCEIDYTHGELAANEAQKYFPNAEIEVKHDLAKKQRILVITPLEFLPGKL